METVTTLETQDLVEANQAPVVDNDLSDADGGDGEDVIESANTSVEPTDGEIEALAADIEDRLLHGDSRLAVGQLVAERYYGGDPERFRSRGRKSVGLRKIAEIVRQGGRVRLSPTQLYRMTGVAFQRPALGEAARKLAFTGQAELLRVEDEAAKRDLAVAAVSERLSIRDLRARVDAHLGVVKPEPTGPVEAAARAAERLSDRLGQLAVNPGFDGEEGPRRRITDALRTALSVVEGEESADLAMGVPTLEHPGDGDGGIEELAARIVATARALGLTNATLGDLFVAVQGRFFGDGSTEERKDGPTPTPEKPTKKSETAKTGKRATRPIPPKERAEGAVPETAPPGAPSDAEATEEAEKPPTSDVAVGSPSEKNPEGLQTASPEPSTESATAAPSFADGETPQADGDTGDGSPSRSVPNVPIVERTDQPRSQGVAKRMRGPASSEDLAEAISAAVYHVPDGLTRDEVLARLGGEGRDVSGREFEAALAYNRSEGEYFFREVEGRIMPPPD